MPSIKRFFRRLLAFCDPEEKRPIISAPIGEVEHPPRPCAYDPSLPPPIFSATHQPYQPGRKFDSYGDSFHPQSIGLPRNHPLRPRITSSLYSRPSDGGPTYVERAHPRRPASSVYSRHTDGRPYTPGGSSVSTLSPFPSWPNRMPPGGAKGSWTPSELDAALVVESEEAIDEAEGNLAREVEAMRARLAVIR
ncbi:MAG: hypothetical protein L6R39_006496 [Caloplaca ligustica]|nr:MAG: hypothetical protein L6R39_006496 [Caloplaca ligustica]